MSKHKFLFKHSLLYNNSKLSAFQNLSDFTCETENSNDHVGSTSDTAAAKSLPNVSSSLFSTNPDTTSANQTNLPVPINGAEIIDKIIQPSLTDYLEDDFRPPLDLIGGQCASDFSTGVLHGNHTALAEPFTLPSWEAGRENETTIGNVARLGNRNLSKGVFGENEVASNFCNSAETLQGFSYDNEYFRIAGFEAPGRNYETLTVSDTLEVKRVPDVVTKIVSTSSLPEIEDSSISSSQGNEGLKYLHLQNASVTVHHSLDLESHPVEESHGVAKKTTFPSPVETASQKSIPTGVITRAPAAPKASIDFPPSSVQLTTVTNKDNSTQKSPIDGVVTEKRRGAKRRWGLGNIIVHEGNPTTYECQVCYKKFRTKANCKYHQHQSASYPYTCETCGKGMMAKTHYEYHLKTHSGMKPHKCSECQREFITLKDLTRHQLTHSSERSHKCGICSRGFHSLPELQRHTAKHNGTQSYSCEICLKKFTVLSELRLHESIHEGTQKFKCTVCTKGFLRQKHLAEHMRIHTGEKPFKCATCPRQFRLESSLDRHNKNHARERPYQCSYPLCNREFLLEKDYKRHLNVHKDEATFKCDLCDKFFRRNDNLKRHIRLHHTEDDITIDTSLFT